MQLEYDCITRTTHTVEIPAQCPGCSADLHNGKLVCEQLEYTEQVATVRDGEIADWCSSSGGPEYVVNGWRCLSTVT